MVRLIVKESGLESQLVVVSPMSITHKACRFTGSIVRRLREVGSKPEFDVLVFDELTLEVLGGLLDEYRVDVLHVREKIKVLSEQVK